MVDLLVFPDAEAIASVALRAANIPNLGTRVYSSIPSSPTYPLATVSRAGGNPAVRVYLDAPRIQVEVWGGAPGDSSSTATKGMIHDISQLARVALMRIAGQTFTGNVPTNAFVSEVSDALGLSWSPDPRTSRDRYIFSVYLYARSI